MAQMITRRPFIECNLGHDHGRDSLQHLFFVHPAIKDRLSSPTLNPCESPKIELLIQ